MTISAEIKNRNALKFYGCMHEDAVELNDGLPLRQRGTKTMLYLSQRTAAKKRGIAWEISLWEWLCVWKESGKWAERGVGKGAYCMARHGDAGPYAVHNVSIQLCTTNSRDAVKKSHATMRANGYPRPKLGTGKGWTLRSGRHKRRYQVTCSAKYVGVFETAAEAEAAYQAAVSKFHASLSVGA